MAMEEGNRRIRLTFRDDDILSDTQKFEGLSRCWVLLKPHQHDAVSDLASHLLHAFQLHQSCPHGLLLSISGFVLPPFESTHILKDNDIISVRKRKDVLSIEGNDAANDAQKLKALGKKPVNSGVLLLESEEFEKEKGGYESDEPEEESEDGGDVGLSRVVENSSGANANKRNRKRKAAERLQGYKEKKQRSEPKHGGNTSSDVCKDKKDGSMAGENAENNYEPAKLCDANNESEDGMKKKKKKRFEAKRGGHSSSDVCKEKKDGHTDGDILENSDEPAKNGDDDNVPGDGVKQKKKRKSSKAKHDVNSSINVCKEKNDRSTDGDTLENSDEPAKHSDNNNVSKDGVEGAVDVQEKDRDSNDTKEAPSVTKKAPSRSARRKKAKRMWLYEMAKIQKQNATCESEGLRNWKEDQAKADRKRLDGLWKGQQKWKNNHVDAQRNEADGQPKGLLQWKVSSHNNGLVKGKSHKEFSQNGHFHEFPNRNGDVHKQQNKKDDNHQPAQNSAAVQEPENKKWDASKQPNHETAEENEVLAVVVRPGYIRFEPLEEGELAVQQDHTPLETFNWNGITSKRKGQQWGKETRGFTPRNDYKTNKEDSETPTKGKDTRPNVGIEFDKLPPLPGLPKKGDLIAYRVLELSSTWTPELSAFRVGKVSWFNMKSNRTMLLPVPEYPIVSEKDDGDEAAQIDDSLYKEDGSLEIDFHALIDVRTLSNGMSVASASNVNAMETGGIIMFTAAQGIQKPILTVSSQNVSIPNNLQSADNQDPNQVKETQASTAEEAGRSIWDQLSESLNAKKEQLAKENGWGSTPKKVLESKKQPISSPGTSNWGQKPEPKQSTGSKSWSYKALRGSALGPTMAMLRSKKDT